MPAAQDLGPASLAFPVTGGALAGERLVVSSRNLAPSRIAVVDLDEMSVVAEHTVAAGTGAWGLAVRGSVVWLGISGARGTGNLLRLDLGAGHLQTVAALDAHFIWALATVDGADVVGALDPVAAFRYSDVSGLARLIGPPSEGTTIVRSIAALGDAVILGGAAGRVARLERLTADGSADVLPPALAGHRTVYVLGSDGARIAAGTRGPGEVDPALVLLDLDDPERSPAVALPGESVVDALLVERGVIHATSRPSGGLYRWVPGTPAELLGVPRQHGETRALVRHGADVVGLGGDGTIWRASADGARLQVSDITELGVRAQPEITQSLGAGDGAVHAGGNFGLTTHDLSTGSARRVFAPGEPKDLAWYRGALHLGMYPIGEVWRLDATHERVEHAFALAPRQNRPQVLQIDRARDRLLVTSASDRDGGGVLHVWDGGRVTPVVDPFGGLRHPAGVTATAELVVVGSSHQDPELLALDAATLAARWRTPVTGGSGLMGVVELDGLVWAAGVRGDLTAVTAADGRIVHHARIAEAGGRLAVLGGRLFAATGDALLEVDRRDGGVRVVLDGLGGRFWGHVPLTADAGALYVLRGDHVVRLVL